MPKCKKCLRYKPVTAFEIRVRGRRRGTCKVCRWTPALIAVRKGYEEVKKARRKAGLNVANWIMVDAKSSDRKKGMKFDLTLEFVKSMISKPCSYCGETKLRMTLDRLDNDVGHIVGNVRAACIRCNYIRKNMPLEAWLCLVSGLRKARKRGLFGKWTGRIK